MSDRSIIIEFLLISLTLSTLQQKESFLGFQKMIHLTKFLMLSITVLWLPIWFCVAVKDLGWCKAEQWWKENRENVQNTVSESQRAEISSSHLNALRVQLDVPPECTQSTLLRNTYAKNPSATVLRYTTQVWDILLIDVFYYYCCYFPRDGYNSCLIFWKNFMPNL